MRTSESSAGEIDDVRHRDRGQILVVFALALVAILAMGGLLIDSGLAWGNRRQAQTAADTAALAAMRAMADNALVPNPYDETNPVQKAAWESAAKAAAVAAGKAMSASNGFPSGPVSCPGGAAVQGVVVNNPPLSGPHIGDTEYVEVISTRAMRTTFSGIVGQTCWLVSARAVARVEAASSGAPGAPYPAVLAVAGPGIGCEKKAYDQTGPRVTIIGDVISNSGINDSNMATYVGSVTYISNPPAICTSAMSFGTPTTDIAVFPKTYTFVAGAHTVTNNATGETVLCTFWFAGSTNLGNGPWWMGGTTASGQLRPGVYCATGDIGLSKNGTTGNVTFVGNGKVSTSAGNINLTAFWDNLLALSFKGGATSDAVKFTGPDGHWQGILFAPNGNVDITGPDGVTEQSALWGQTVHTSGPGWTLDSTSLTGPSSTTTDYKFGQLVE